MGGLREGDEVVARHYIPLGRDEDGITEGTRGWIMGAGPPYTVSFPRDSIFGLTFREVSGLDEIDLELSTQPGRRLRDRPVSPPRWWRR
jgi:hypothetical protein